MNITVTEPIKVSFLVGQVTFNASCLTDLKKLIGFCIFQFSLLAGAEGLEPSTPGFGDPYSTNEAYSIILVTTPAPTVLPPSRIANFKPSFIAIGLIKVTVIFASSPGMIISVPSGKVTSPVTSVVLK